MKVLLLLSGYPGNINSVNDTSNLKYSQVDFEPFYKGLNYLRNLLRNHETKVICSIWDNIGSEKVIKCYKPELLSSHNQKEFQNDFNKKYKNLERNRVLDRANWFNSFNLKDELFVPTSRYASQLFIRQEVCKTAVKFLKNSNFSPKLIIISRFDISTRGGLDVRNPIEISNNLEKLFSINTKHPFIVIPEFNQLNLGYPDMWFYLNKNTLLKMQKLYDVYINSIFEKDSLYMNYLTNGWPSSEFFDFKNKYDLRQFSNITLTSKNILKKMKYPSWESNNIHMYYKYFISLHEKPFQIYFSNKYRSFCAMFKFLEYKFLIRSLINDFASLIKNKIILILKKLQSLFLF